MVMLKLGLPFIDISGKYNGAIYSRDKSGLHMIAPPVRKDRTPSEAQQLRRKAFQHIINLWYNELAVETANEWGRWASTHPEENKLSEQVYWTGLGWFLHFNINRRIDNLPPVLEPPWDW